MPRARKARRPHPTRAESAARKAALIKDIKRGARVKGPDGKRVPITSLSTISLAKIYPISHGAIGRILREANVPRLINVGKGKTTRIPVTQHLQRLERGTATLNGWLKTGVVVLKNGKSVFFNDLTIAQIGKGCNLTPNEVSDAMVDAGAARRGGRITQLKTRSITPTGQLTREFLGSDLAQKRRAVGKFISLQPKAKTLIGTLKILLTELENQKQAVKILPERLKAVEEALQKASKRKNASKKRLKTLTGERKQILSERKTLPGWTRFLEILIEDIRVELEDKAHDKRRRRGK